jgi:ABC-type multidrug transport system fused ATPase/permease subunit
LITTVQQTMHLIGRRYRSRWMGLIVLASITSGFEMMGAALVYVLVSLVADPSGQIDLPVVGDVRRFATGIDERTLLLALLSAMAAFFVIRGAVHVGSAYAQKRVAANAGARLSSKLVEGYLRFPYPLHLERNSAELVRNAQQAVNQLVNQVFLPLIQVMAQLLLVSGLLTLMVSLAPLATLIAVCLIGGMAAVVLLFVQPRLKAQGQASHQAQLETFAILQQSLHGIRDLKVLGRERYFARRYARSRLRVARAQYMKAPLSALPSTLIELGLIGFILVYFGVTVSSGANVEGSLSVLGLFAYVGLRLQPSVQIVIAGLNELKFSTAPLEDLNADLHAVESLPPWRPSVDRLPFGESIVLEHVSFRYQGAETAALSDIDLEIRAGETVGICGPTGGGKTTLVDLITGLLPPTAGRVMVDGHDLQEHDREWHENLGVVPQMVFLVDDTLRGNIALGIDEGDVDEAALSEALSLAQLTEVVETLPAGLETRVGERGLRLSGGQRQRVAIARALYRRPAVLIFDEGTSALDNATEARLMSAIEALRGRHTIILVAHRLSTVRNVDRVVFVEDGHITGLDSYDQLVATNPSFRALAEVT